MTRVAVTLYDHPDNATDVIHELRRAGFDDTQIECIEPDPTTQDYTRRVRGEGQQEQQIDAEESLGLMEHIGIAEDDARHYLDEITRGRSMVAVKAEEEISGRARQIMNRYPLREEQEVSTLDAPRQQAPVSASHRPGDPNSRRDRTPSAGSTEILEVADQPHSGRGEDVTDKPAKLTEPETKVVRTTDHSEEPRHRQEPPVDQEMAEPETKVIRTTDHGEEPRHREPPADREVEKLAEGELSGQVAEERFKLYRPDLVRHYEQHYAALGEYSFDDYVPAYRWGMALAANRSHGDDTWSEIEPVARRGWQNRTGVGWDRFREAVRFGWYLIRGEEEMYSGRPGHR